MPTEYLTQVCGINKEDLEKLTRKEANELSRRCEAWRMNPIRIIDNYNSLKTLIDAPYQEPSESTIPLITPEALGNFFTMGFIKDSDIFIYLAETEQERSQREKMLRETGKKHKIGMNPHIRKLQKEYAIYTPQLEGKPVMGLAGGEFFFKHPSKCNSFEYMLVHEGNEPLLRTLTREVENYTVDYELGMGDNGFYIGSPLDLAEYLEQLNKFSENPELETDDFFEFGRNTRYLLVGQPFQLRTCNSDKIKAGLKSARKKIHEMMKEDPFLSIAVHMSLDQSKKEKEL